MRRIEPESHVPVYLQIVEHLRSAIAAGVYRPGEALPSLRVLATDLKVNPNTVQRAYEELDRQGVIRSHRGVGMFVAERGAHAGVARRSRSTRPSCRRSPRRRRPVWTRSASGSSSRSRWSKPLNRREAGRDTRRFERTGGRIHRRQ